MGGRVVGGPSRRGFLRGLGAAALAAGGAGTLAACGGSSGSGAVTGGSGEPSGSITVWSWKNPAAELRALIPAFNAVHPKVQVNVQDIGNPAIWDKITIAMEAGGQGLADLLHIGVDYLPSYIEKFPGGLADLSQLGANQYATSFAPGLWQTVSRGSKVYALPWEANAAGFFLRADLFKKAGVDPSSLLTWDDVIVAGKKVKAATGTALFAVDKSASQADSANLFQLLMQLQGAFYFNLDGKITLNSPEAARALTLIKEMDDAGLLADVQGSPGITGYDTAVKSGKVAICPDPAWYGGYLETLAPDLKGDWQLILPPAVTPGGSRSAIVNSTHLAVSGTSKNQRAAFAFAEFALTRPDSQVSIFKAKGIFPALLKAYDDPVFHQSDPYFGGQKYAEVFVEELAKPSTPTNYTSDYARALKAVDDAQTKVLLQGADPAAALKAAASQLAQQTRRSQA
ncbi:lactose/L-arabinose transport system substrate-binding protein [Kitasatospora sp. GP30]|uniref:ABC transporter substrate-binding protein n=1 Tax=Kitasatospora sp. GP30 TaxID=3035084 RepID=UPI000C70B4E2|nr:extracellular solute-binding protein [Kitasatospora sp. GP30]MDH6143652.1 lactose/L-arabinose transport system substrate-binding protein [Kitasatospora sp. GP30]